VGRLGEHGITPEKVPYGTEDPHIRARQDRGRVGDHSQREKGLHSSGESERGGQKKGGC